MLELTDHRGVNEPRDRTDRASKATDGDVEERPHDHGIELRARAASEFLSRPRRTCRPLVRARRGHHLEGVGHGDDACAERDLLASQTVGISRSIMLLMVLGNREAPLAEPRTEWGDQPCTF